MANTIYNGKQNITTIARRDFALEKIRDLTTHIVVWGVNIVNLDIDQVTHKLTLILDGPIPVDQIDHLGLVGPV